jgi:prepilin-type N-terminal cleavage/methylation domain-containing protein
MRIESAMERQRTRSRRGFTLIDLMVTLTVIVIVAALVVPRLQDDTRLRLIGASRMVASDIELAQLMTIANPQDATVVRFQNGTGEYWLASASAPDDPIDRAGVPDGYRVIFGQGDASHAAGVTMVAANIANNTLTFNAQGGIEDLTSEPAVTLMLDSRWIKLYIAPTTGVITESSDAD